MTAKSYLLLLLHLIGGGWLSAQSEASVDTAYVTVLRADPTGSDTLSFLFYRDFLTLEEEIYPIPSDSSMLRIPIRESGGRPGFLVQNGERIPIFLETGDSLWLQSIGTNSLDSLQYTGKGALANSYLLRAFRQFDSQDGQRITTAMGASTADQYQQFLNDLRAEKAAFANSFLTERDTQFSTAFDQYLKADLNFWWGQHLLRYRRHHPAADELPVSANLPERYYDFLDSLNLNDSTALNNVNYLLFLDQYLNWRQELITAGKLRLKDNSEVQLRRIRVKAIQNYAEVTVNSLGVRTDAHDALSVFARLQRGMEVLYLQDVTNEYFSYVIDRKRYLGKFIKIELADGRQGWVPQNGTHLRQKKRMVEKWVEVPDMRPEVMQNFKYAAFKGKVLHYAIARDLYRQAADADALRSDLIWDYLRKERNSPFRPLLEKMVRQQAVATQSVRLTASNVPPGEYMPLGEKLRSLTQKTAARLVASPSELSAEKKRSQPTTVPQTVGLPDLTAFDQATEVIADFRVPVSQPLQLLLNDNLFERKETVLELNGRNGGTLRLETMLQMPTSARLQMGQESVELLLRPGEDLTFELTGHSLLNNLNFTGPNAALNNVLLELTRTFKTADEGLDHQLRNAEPAAFQQFMTVLRDRKRLFLDEQQSTVHLSEDQYQYARASIDYWFAFHLMNYPYEHPIFHNQPTPMPVPDDYYAFMDDLSADRPDAMPLRYYQHYLQDFLSYHQRTDNRSRVELADHYLNGQSRYFVKASQEVNKMKRKDRVANDPALLAFLAECPYPLYQEYLKRLYHQAQGLTAGMSAPDFQLVNRQGQLVSLDDLRGKVVLLDFWATWCQPCLRQMPAHHALQERFDEDAVAFVYVSMDQKTANWHRFLSTHPTFKGTHVLANDELIRDYQVERLPFHLLLDTDGKIVWKNTGGFGVEAISRRIEALLQ